MPRGRPNKLNHRLIALLEDAILTGMPIEDVCRFAGIRRSSYYGWLKRGKKEKVGVYREFYESNKMAHVRLEIKLVEQITNAKPWQSKAFILERRFPNEWSKYGRKDEENHSNDPDLKREPIVPDDKNSDKQKANALTRKRTAGKLAVLMPVGAGKL